MTNWIRGDKSQRVFTAMVIGGLLLFVFALSTLMLPYSSVIEEQGGLDLTCLQIPFTSARANEIVASYDDEALAAARALHLPGDILFPIGYALLYGGLIGLVVRRQDGIWLQIGVIAFLQPFAAMIFDWGENLFILRMLAQPEGGIPGWIPFLGSVAGVIKYGLLSVLTPLYGVAVVANLLRHRKAITFGAVLLYIFVVGMLLFNVYRLFSDVVPCLLAI